MTCSFSRHLDLCSPAVVGSICAGIVPGRRLAGSGQGAVLPPVQAASRARVEICAVKLQLSAEFVPPFFFTAVFFFSSLKLIGITWFGRFSNSKKEPLPPSPPPSFVGPVCSPSPAFGSGVDREPARSQTAPALTRPYRGPAGLAGGR